MPRVSVVIPVFNAERYIVAAVKSVLEQSFTDFELIAINDGSTDQTTAALRTLAAGDARMRLFEQPNKGYAATLNDGCALARGEFIARMDADDICAPERFQAQVDFLDSHPEVAVVGSRILQIDPEGQPVCEWYFDQAHEAIDKCHLARRGSAIAHPAAMIRADAFREIGGYRKEFEPAEDIDLWLRLGERHKLANIGRVLLCYRLHERSVSHQRQLEQNAKMIRAVEEAVVRRGGSCEPAGQTRSSGTEVSIPPRVRWARMALNAGVNCNARRLARKAIRRHPTNPLAWRTLTAALMGKHARSLAAALAVPRLRYVQ